jgi:AcrR family transcriptional regulator
MTAPIPPIYRRLPHGPHRLSRSEVIHNQRIRMHGAMIEAVAENGFQETSVRQIVSLAGVSRRSFYEQFASKEACFLATFDLLAGLGVQRMSSAYLEAGGDLEDRLRAGLGEFARFASTRQKATVLVIVESQTAGAAALLRLRRATVTCERLLCRSFSDAPGASRLAPPIVRAIAGGLHGTMSARLCERGATRSSDIAEEMLGWTLRLHSASAEPMAERIAQRITRRLAESHLDGRALACAPAPAGDERERLLHNALRLAVLDDYGQLTAPQIAEEANVSIDAFFELFADKDECFLAALDMLAEELLAITADPDLLSSDWPRAVRRVIGELMRFLAEHPLYAQTIAQEAFGAGPQAARRNLELGHAIATLLTKGAPRNAHSRLTVEGLAGAIWHTIRCNCAATRIQLLPALSDYLAYVALAPLIGADAAAEILSEDAAS